MNNTLRKLAFVGATLFPPAAAGQDADLDNETPVRIANSEVAEEISSKLRTYPDVRDSGGITVSGVEVDGYGECSIGVGEIKDDATSSIYLRCRDSNESIWHILNATFEFYDGGGRYEDINPGTECGSIRDIDWVPHNELDADPAQCFDMMNAANNALVAFEE